MIWFFRIFGSFLVLATLVPLIPTGKWFVRCWDFPRLQLAVLSIALFLVAIIGVSSEIQNVALNVELIVWILLLFGAICWQFSHIIRFSPLWKKEIPSGDHQADANMIKFMVANLNVNNHESVQAVINDLSEEACDVLLLIELNDKWFDSLKPLRDQFAYHYEYVRDEGLGIAIWSQVTLRDSTTNFLVSDRRASLWTQLVTSEGTLINFVGVHPTPPGLLDSTGETRRDSRVRDAELVLVAKEIAKRSDETWVVAGDFNDVAWSHTTRLFKRTSGLMDPRIGRSFMGTFIAQYPVFRFPIDHIFLSQGFKVSSLCRKKITGSDHFAVLAVVYFDGKNKGVTPRPIGNDPDEAGRIVAEGIRDAKEREVCSPETTHP